MLELSTAKLHAIAGRVDQAVEQSHRQRDAHQERAHRRRDVESLGEASDDQGHAQHTQKQALTRWRGDRSADRLAVPEGDEQREAGGRQRDRHRATDRERRAAGQDPTEQGEVEGHHEVLGHQQRAQAATDNRCSLGMRSHSIESPATDCRLEQVARAASAPFDGPVHEAIPRYRGVEVGR